ncbi:basic secretory protein-like protein [Mangrovibacterium lignilyticum]|uniref:basic secretory protein-like protein n=1 Tax=Mangrovibacterium lignilyticum TaxID=2668052 RepID=UPI0013D2C607|nr:basic secretory protein-like protein [Mangrovibacterium lignilyticum]
MSIKTGFVLLCFLSLSQLVGSAQTADTTSNSVTIQHSGYTLVFINQEPSFNPELAEILQETFFEVYPPMCKKFNPKSARTVTFVIDPKYDGVAATSEARVVYNPRWFAQHPGDIDVVTHEVMHIVQAYGNTNGPWWITEGIADYVRFKFGLDNAGANWSLPKVTEKQNFDNSYRVTARFFAWIVKNKNRRFIEKMDKIMRSHQYTADIWVKLTGKNPSELWKEYTANPEI